MKRQHRRKAEETTAESNAGCRNVHSPYWEGENVIFKQVASFQVASVWCECRALISKDTQSSNTTLSTLSVHSYLCAQQLPVQVPSDNGDIFDEKKISLCIHYYNSFIRQINYFLMWTRFCELFNKAHFCIFVNSICKNSFFVSSGTSRVAITRFDGKIYTIGWSRIQHFNIKIKSKINSQFLKMPRICINFAPIGCWIFERIGIYSKYEWTTLDISFFLLLICETAWRDELNEEIHIAPASFRCPLHLLLPDKMLIVNFALLIVYSMFLVASVHSVS